MKEREALKLAKQLISNLCTHSWTTSDEQYVLKAIDEALAQPEQEPDYWLGYGLQAHTEKPFEDATPIYTTPPQRKPLTDEQKEKLWCDKFDGCTDFNSFLLISKAIEAAHGIKE